MQSTLNFTRSGAVKRLAIAVLAALASALAMQTVATAEELLTDGGFENDTGGIFNPPWIQLGDVSFSFPVCGISSIYPPAPEGDCMGVFGPTDPGTIAQSVNTTVGANYLVSFILGSDGVAPNAFTASFGGFPIFSLIDVPSTFATHEIPVVATANSSTLAFTFQDPNGFLFLDAASVTRVPEPASLALLSLALAALAGARRGRRT